MFLLVCVGLGVFFIVICLCLLFDITDEQTENGYIKYMSSNGYIRSIIWADTKLYEVIYQYKKHFNINPDEKLYIKVYYMNTPLTAFDICSEHRFDKVEIITCSDIEHCKKNRIPVREILNYSDTICISRDGNIKYDT